MKTPLYLLITIAFSTVIHGQLIDSIKPDPSAGEEAAQSVLDSVNSELLRRCNVHRASFDLIWRNRKATPSQVLATLGTRAGLVFAFAHENLDHIDRCAKIVGKTRADFISDADCIPPLAFTAHADGTITID